MDFGKLLLSGSVETSDPAQQELGRRTGTVTRDDTELIYVGQSRKQNNTFGCAR